MLLAVALSSAAATPDALLKSAADRLNSAKSLVASYRVTAEGHTMKGELVVAKEKFKIEAPQVKSWFDGKTQWTYSAEIGEVNVTEPAAEELSQVNPFAIINAFRANYRSKAIKTTGDVQLIEMIPLKKGGNISKILLTLNTRTLYPSKIVIYTDSGTPMTIDILSVSEGQLLPDNFFRFDAKKFPGVEVVDLR